MVATAAVAEREEGLGGTRSRGAARGTLEVNRAPPCDATSTVQATASRKVYHQTFHSQVKMFRMNNQDALAICNMGVTSELVEQNWSALRCNI